MFLPRCLYTRKGRSDNHCNDPVQQMVRTASARTAGVVSVDCNPACRSGQSREVDCLKGSSHTDSADINMLLGLDFLAHASPRARRSAGRAAAPLLCMGVPHSHWSAPSL